MSFETLLKEVEALNTFEQRRLLSYLVVLEDRREVGYAEKLAKKIDDATPGRWLTVEECEGQLGLEDDHA